MLTLLTVYWGTWYLPQATVPLVLALLHLPASFNGLVTVTAILLHVVAIALAGVVVVQSSLLGLVYVNYSRFCFSSSAPFFAASVRAWEFGEWS